MPSLFINASDQIRLQHMRDAAQAALSFMEMRDRPDLVADLQLAFAVIRAIEIIGEAANRVSKDLQNQTPHIDWSGMIGMRNILIHNYFDIDQDEVWAAIQKDIPLLLSQLKQLLSPSQNQD